MEWILVLGVGLFLTIAGGQSTLYTWKENMQKAKGENGKDYSYDPLEKFSEKSGLNVVAWQL